MKKTKRSRVGLAFLAVIAALVAAALFYFNGCGRAKKPSVQDEVKTCEAVRIVSAVIALVEHPTAARVVLIGDRAEDYRPFFADAGLSVAEGATVVETDDIVFFAGKAKVKVKGKELSFERPSPTGGPLYVRCIDARNLPADCFKEMIESHPGDEKHLWMPGVSDWVLVGRKGGLRQELAAMMDVFSREDLFGDLARAECDSLAGLFANYVGTDADVMPAFNEKNAAVRADNFVTREVPSFDWIDAADVDADIRDAVLADIRTAQVVRRVVLEGNLQADEGRQDEAIAAWARAALRNPQDTMLVERITHLRVNAQTFEKVANFPMAARCYETIARIFPNDPAPLLKFAKCVESMGDKKLAKTAYERAKLLLSAQKRRK